MIGFKEGGRIYAHFALALAAVIWGLMAPVGKDAMASGVSAVSLASMRMIGGAVCFWIMSFFVKKEKVAPGDYSKMFGAALLGIVFNQGAYTFGLSLTSPVDASIIVTVMPVFTLLLASMFLKEPITLKKAGGVMLGLSGAVVLVLSGSSGLSGHGSSEGNMLCICASLSFACYLTFFRGLISRYSVFTLMKWMFTFAALCFLPVAGDDLAETFRSDLGAGTWAEMAYVVFFGTFVAYILMLYGQQNLRPTLVSMYNYVQPVVSTAVSVIAGLAAFGWIKVAAAALIFLGVYLVTISKAARKQSEFSLLSSGK